MPELPEVETVRRGLQPVLEGRVIVRADIRRPDLRWPFPTSMAKRLIGTRILGIRRRSKYILVDLSSGETLIVHLGMSGRILIADARLGDFHLERATAKKHDHVEIELDSGGCLTFNDPRRFGAMDLWPTEALEEHWLLAELGPEPLGNEFEETYLVRRLRGRKISVKAALLDQKTVAGLGNIYACEALYRAGISPRRNAGKISERRVALMVPVIREVLGEAIEAGGSSLRDFRRTDGELGYFQHSFRVYDREGMSCRTHACKATIRRIVQSGRSTFYCPNCQR